MSARAAVAASLLLAAAPAPAAESLLDFQAHGFAGQGYVLTDGNNVNGPSDRSEGSVDFRELGVNASWRPFGSLLLSAQMAGVHTGAAIDEAVTLEYGLADWAALQGERGRLGFRGGKLKLPIGLYNDARDNIFTRPGIIMPNSVYLETNGSRAFGYYALQGGGLYGDWYLGDHAVYLEAVLAGSQELGDNAEIPILRRVASGEFDLDQGVVVRVMDDYGGGRWRTALSVLRADLTYEAQPSGPFDPLNQDGQFDFDQAVLSLQYNGAKLSVTAELVARHIEITDLSGPPFPLSPLIGEAKQDPGGYYLQASWRFTPALQGLVRYDEQIRDLSDRGGHDQAEESAAASAASGGALPALPRYYYFGRDWTVGTRYDVFTNLALWAEFHVVDGVGWVNPLDNPGFATGDADRYWTLFTTMLGYRF